MVGGYYMIEPVHTIRKFRCNVADVGVGYLILNMRDNGKLVGMIEDVEVLEEHRGKGFGKKVILELIEKAKELGCYKVILDCSDHNISFYSLLGFELWQNSMRLDIE